MTATTMVHTDSNGKKELSTDKQAIIKIDEPGTDDVRTVEAQHYIESDGTVSIYLGSRSDGIDIQTHISRCVIDRVQWHAGNEGVCIRCGVVATLGEEKKCHNCYHLACPGCDTGHVGGYEGAPSCTENCGVFAEPQTVEPVPEVED